MGATAGSVFRLIRGVDADAIASGGGEGRGEMLLLTVTGGGRRSGTRSGCGPLLMDSRRRVRAGASGFSKLSKLGTDCVHGG